MYEAFFGLKQEPFSIAPDPRFLFLTDKHRLALALLNHGLSRGAGFVLLTGEIGAGKSTVWRAFLESLPSNFDVANVVNPRLDVNALLSPICDDLHVELPAAGGPTDLIDALHGHLLLAHAQGRRTLIVIDEAQALSPAVLEQLRLLTNLDSTGRLLHVMLIGQPELRAVLEHEQLEPLAQRIVGRFYPRPLSAAETTRYIEHRLKVAGLSGPLPFDAEALALVHRLCRGVPRRINVLSDHALTAACTQGKLQVDAGIVARAAADAFDRPPELPPAAAPEPVSVPPPADRRPQPANGGLGGGRRRRRRCRRRRLARATVHRGPRCWQCRAGTACGQRGRTGTRGGRCGVGSGGRAGPGGGCGADGPRDGIDVATGAHLHCPGGRRRITGLARAGPALRRQTRQRRAVHDGTGVLALLLPQPGGPGADPPDRPAGHRQAR
jgi:general secretion pathway protein A